MTKNFLLPHPLSLIPKLAIIGVGLIGGSLGLCLKDKLGDEIFITGLCRTEKSMKAAMELGAVDFASNDLEKVVGDADFIFLSPPVLQIVPMVQKILPYLKDGAIITYSRRTEKNSAPKCSLRCRTPNDRARKIWRNCGK